MEKTRALVSKEKEYRSRIRNLRKKLFRREMELERTVCEYAALEASIKNFYKNYYLKKLGHYLVLLEDLKNKILGIKRSEAKKEEKEKMENPQANEAQIKRIYRKLARLYHPDNFDNLDGDEKSFYHFRMSEINEAFEKRDLKTLERIEKKAEIELDSSASSPLERIRHMEDDIYLLGGMISLYNEKKRMLGGNEMAVLMSKSPAERDRMIEEIRERLVSEIKTYREICSRLGY